MSKLTFVDIGPVPKSIHCTKAGRERMGEPSQSYDSFARKMQNAAKCYDTKPFSYPAKPG